MHHTTIRGGPVIYYWEPLEIPLMVLESALDGEVLDQLVSALQCLSDIRLWARAWICIFMLVKLALPHVHMCSWRGAGLCSRLTC